MTETATLKEPEAPGASHGGSEITTLRIDGMTCGNCARHVTEALRSVPGVQLADVTLQTSEGRVRWSAGVDAAPDKLIRAIEAAGYSAEEIEPAAAKPATESLSAWKLNLWLGALVTLPLMIGEWVFSLDTQLWFRW